MLQIKNISKTYVTGDLEQRALDDVNLNFRDNEFVAVLGPSGSGKTTLLNIIGGLDQYDRGDLIINGISTKDYTDRDWDSYRNHTIGFVFQSYNLIPHQTVLSNVELALTISGISRSERKQRAIEALKQVGLGDQIHKKPNQLSGGQMQRVAIARALINNPDILLADEPTGALDTETSVQVMDLLKDVAKDRMVIMVTHNPELAEEYATRIVYLKDGKITNDTNPYFVNEINTTPPVHQNMGHSSMSMITSLGLSFQNLIIKRGRTLLTCFAGSVGIIAIALILAVSSGVNGYIDALEEDTMAEYPVQVTSSGIDMSSMLGTMMGTMEQLNDDTQEDGIRVATMISRMVNIMDSNDLAPFKEYLESGQTDIYDYAKAIEYIYDVEPQIYLEDGNSYHQVNPENTLTSSFGLSSTLTSMMSSMTSMMSTFFQLPENESLYADSYEMKAGRWPESYDECVLVLSSTGTIADYMVYTLGLRDFSEYEQLIDDSLNNGVSPEIEYDDVYNYDNILGITYKLVNGSDYYEYDSEYDVWTDKRDNEEYMEQLVKDGEDLTIVGVVQPLEDATAAILTEGINYPASLIEHIATVAENSSVVQDQLAHPDVNVLTGEEFGDDFTFDLEEMFNFDDDAFSDLFDFDDIMDTLIDEMDFSDIDMGDMSDMLGDMELDLSDMDLSEALDMSEIDMDLSDLDLNLDMSELDINLDNMNLDFDQMFDNMDLSSFISPSSESLTQITQALTAGYNDYANSSGVSSYADLQNDFIGYLDSNDAQSVFRGVVNQMIEDAANNITRQDVEALLQDDSGDIQTAISNLIIRALGTVNVPQTFASQFVSGYENYAITNGKTTSADVTASLSGYLDSEEAMQIITQGMYGMIDMDGLQNAMSSAMDASMQQMMTTINNTISNQMASQMSLMQSQIEEQMGAAMAEMTDQIETQISEVMSGMTDEIEAQIEDAMSGMTDQLADTLSDSMEDVMSEAMDNMADNTDELFDFDSDDIMDVFDIDMDEDSLLELMTSMSDAAGSSYDGVLADLGYVNYDNPAEIDIYPKDFDSKDGITAVIDEYNEIVDENGEEEKEISYTDLVGTMMSTVSTIINLVSYVLIAFVSVSLVVSSIMIGIITYISVLERTREIGILRAIGASKRNVARIFNAETFIVGLIAGVLGVVIALLLLIPVNMVVHNFVQADDAVAYLPASYGILLIVLSIVLTLIGGIIPSRKASKMDPVTALHTD